MLLYVLAAILQPQPATPVSPGTSDVSTLAAPLQLEPASLLMESDFSRVYELTPTPGLFGRPETRRFARRAGAVTAIFPQSSYIESESGTISVVPNDTVFMIGEVPEPAKAEDDAPMPLSANLSAARAVSAEARPTARQRVPAAPSDRHVSLWTDASYREHRLSTILDEAARR